MLDAVADAGPLIHLDEVDLAEALHVFRRVTVPEPVAAEVRMQPRGPGTRLLRTRHVHVTPPSLDEKAVASTVAFRRLGGVDRIVLAMAQSRDAPVLTDDLDLRDAAHALGLQPVGTIGLVVRASRTGILQRSDALAGLDRLLDSSMFVTNALVDRAKAAL